MTQAEFESALGAFLFEKWLAEVGWDRETLRGFFEHGIPADYAKVISDLTEGRLPASLWPKLLHPPKALHKRRGLSILDNKQMDIDHKLAISRGRKSSKTDAAFKAAYRERNYTLTTLAEAVDCDAPLLSKYRRKLRRIPQERAEKVARLICWPADLAHWPGGIVPKD